MFSLKLFILIALIAVFVAAEPPRRRRLPLRVPARQTAEETEPEGYSYPKPTDTYGPPTDTYGPPAEEEPIAESDVEAVADEDGPPADESEDSQPQQFRAFRRNQKLRRAQPAKFQRQPNFSLQQARVIRLN
jgi:hypothetical protein